MIHGTMQSQFLEACVFGCRRMHDTSWFTQICQINHSEKINKNKWASKKMQHRIKRRHMIKSKNMYARITSHHIYIIISLFTVPVLSIYLCTSNLSSPIYPRPPHPSIRSVLIIALINIQYMYNVSFFHYLVQLLITVSSFLLHRIFTQREAWASLLSRPPPGRAAWNSPGRVSTINIWWLETKMMETWLCIPYITG